MRWLYLYFPGLYLQHLLQDIRPGEPQPPLALLPQSGHRQTHLLQCNDVARRAGVCADMPLATALCLCPALQVRRLDPRQQTALLHSRALWAGQFSALVSPDDSDGLWLESASMLQLFQGADALRQRIQHSAAQEGWRTAIGAGDTPYAARLRALCQLPASSGHADLSALPLSALQQGRIVDEARLHALQRLGIRTLSDILRLPQSGISTRLGDDLSRTIRRLLGHEAHPLNAFQPADVFVQQVPFLTDVEHANGLLFPLQRLLGRLSEFLQRRQFSTRCLQLIISHRRGSDSHWQVRFAHGEYRRDELLFICRHFLEKQRLPSPAQSLTLSVHDFLPRTHQQAGLLKQRPGERRDDSHYLLNRLGTRLDDHQLQQLQASADPRPEQAAAFLPGDSSAQRPAASLRSDACARPLWLLETPIPCPPPDAVIAGPERLCGGWWDGDSVRRDYYQAEQNGRRVWLFHCADGWFMHGIFS